MNSKESAEMTNYNEESNTKKHEETGRNGIILTLTKPHHL